jgi:hypothetical protein
VENYDKLKSIIQQANSSILELKFGCEVVYEGKKCKYLHYIEGWFHVLLPPNYDKGILQVTNPKLKILGRPIRLADVLWALEKLQKEISVRTDGRFLQQNKNFWESMSSCGEDCGLPQFIDWNLRDDNLDHQSEETKQFLIELLTN